jgi:hypothetical protein
MKIMCSLTYELITGNLLKQKLFHEKFNFLTNIIVKTKGSQEFDKIKKLNCWASNLNDVSILKNLPNIEVLTLRYFEILFFLFRLKFLYHN